MQTQKKSRSSPSMRRMMTVMMVGLVAVTIIIFAVLLVAFRLIPTMNDYAYRTMYDQTTAQSSRVGSELGSIQRSVLRTNGILEAEMRRLLEDQGGIPFSNLGYYSDSVDSFLSSAYDELTSVLGEQAVSGAFVVLETQYEGSRHEGQVALYLRSPQSTAASNSAKTLLRGPSKLSELQDLGLERSWSHTHVLGEGPESDFYHKPVEAAKIYTKAGAIDLGYWSPRFRLGPNDVEVITYSMPLLGNDGEVYGVCGVELSLSNLSRITPIGDLAFPDGFYLLGHFDDGTIPPENLLSNDLNGEEFIRDMSGPIQAGLAANTAAYEIYSLQTDNHAKMLASIVKLDLYTRNSPFRSEQYYLFVVAPREQVLALSYSITQNILLMLFVAGFLSVAGAILLSRYFAMRTEKLATAAATLDPEKPVSLPRTNIHELDLLSDVLEQMNADVAAHAARMSTIVDSVGMPMGAFEIQGVKKNVFLTDSLFRLLEIPHVEEDSQYMSIGDFLKILPQVNAPEEEGGTVDFSWTPLHPQYNPEEDGQRWLRLTRVKSGEFVYGTVLDITEEVKEKERLEYERNYDPLTKLLNRNAYSEMMTCLIRKMPDKMGILLFGDLDNLKTVNDTFGHDTGDRYIQMAANALSMFNNEGGVAARISGDEFAAYLHGGDSKEELRRKVDDLLAEMREREMVMPDGNRQKVRISVGLAYYPNDADNIPELIKFADFAMYEIKHSYKGGTNEFDLESYQRNSHILDRPNHMELLLDQKRSRFAFQPIVEAKTGRVFGYEALMRPQTREMYSPTQVISMARSQSKLSQLEKVTIFSLMDWLEQNDDLGEAALFFNSMPSQVISDKDVEKIREKMRRINCNLVMEISEEEQGDPERLEKKMDFSRRCKLRVAVDNFGLNQTDTSMVMDIRPDYIKVDIGVIRSIDRKPERQKLVQSIVELANREGFRVVAEGVETFDEFQTVSRLGVHYVQGFYICRPEYRLVKELPKTLLHKIQEITDDLGQPEKMEGIVGGQAEEAASIDPKE